MNRVFSPKRWLSFRFALGLAVALTDAPFAVGCGWSGYDCSTCDSFFAPEVIGELGVAPFFKTSHAFYLTDDQEASVLDDANVKEWVTYLGTVSAASVRSLIYKTSLADVDFLIFSLQGKRPGKGSDLARTLVSELQGSAGAKMVKALYYLGYAKRVEPLAIKARVEAGWGRWPAEGAAKADVPVADITKLLAAGDKQANALSDEFLTQRYRLQSLRLLFYARDFVQAREYFDKYKESVKGEGYAHYRFLAFGAGALARTKQVAAANALYSQIFASYVPLKKSAYLSFRPQEESDWTQTLALARTPREKAQLWQLFGLYHDGPRAIKEIYAIDPKSELLPLLLVRAVNAAEGPLSKEAPGRADATIGLLRKIADEGQAIKPEIWWLAVGHLYALSGDAQTAATYLDKVEHAQSKDVQVQQQLALSRVVQRTLALPKAGGFPSPLAGDHVRTVAADFNWLFAKGGDFSPWMDGEAPSIDGNRAGHFFYWFRHYLAQGYARSGDYMRALILEPRSSDPYYQDNANVEKLQAMLANAPKDAFDAFLTKLKRPSEAELNEMKAINLMYSGKFAEAAKLFPAGSTLRGDPFASHVVDCHDCDHAVKHAKPFTKVAFAQRMAELKVQAAEPKQGSAQAAYDLATGYYNMSHFGNARALYGTTLDTFPTFLPRQMDTKQALKFYEQSAETAKDRELQAKAHFMAAKAERDGIYVSRQTKDALTYDGLYTDSTYVVGKHFKLLADNYTDTQYYKEAIAECGFFKRFTGK